MMSARTPTVRRILSPSGLHTPTIRHAAHSAPRRTRVAARAAVSAQSVTELKRKLLEAAGDADIEVTEDLKQHLGQLEAAVGDNLPKISLDKLIGRFRTLVNTSVTLERGRRTDLGTLTFKQFKPVDLKLVLPNVELFQGVEEPDEYNTKAYFEVTEGEYKGLKGVQTAIGTFKVNEEKPNRQDVYFGGIRIEPAPGTDLSKWLKALKADNPMMDNNGVAEIRFPSEMHGFRDFLIFDDDLHFTVGNRKGYVAVKRI